MIIGRNGAGKSTLLKSILGEINHTGKVEFFDMKENKKKKIKIGYVPQHLNVERDMPTTVYDMFASYVSNKPVWLMKDKGLYKKIREALRMFGAEKLIDKRVGNLSSNITLSAYFFTKSKSWDTSIIDISYCFFKFDRIS